MFKSFVLVVTLSSLLAQTAFACDKGQYKQNLPGGNSICLPCPEGTYQPDDNFNGATCRDVSAGHEANQKLGATEEIPCGEGYYSAGGTDTCHECPAGTECTKEANTEPTLCHYGHYQPNAASPEPCAPCPRGQFNNVRGATSCCTCCSGYYQKNTGKRDCEKCPASRPFSRPGAVNNGENGEPGDTNGCQADPTPTGPVSTCEQKQDDTVCPVTDGPSPSHVPRALKKRCARGHKKCAALHGRGGWDCVDVANNIESCGGCIDLDNTPGSGKDCTTIEGANNVQCVRGQCVVHSCRHGYELNSTGGCNPVLVASKVKRHH
ncbi:Dihydroxyacetone synthase [Tulasnella sp. 419]|nr:Dihydroxyacetone synthase [Tulasnella sp. 419]